MTNPTENARIPLMKYKIVKHYNKETGHFTGYELKSRLFFPLPWKSLRCYGNRQAEIEHDVVWLLELAGKVKTGDSFD